MSVLDSGDDYSGDYSNITNCSDDCDNVKEIIVNASVFLSIVFVGVCSYVWNKKCNCNPCLAPCYIYMYVKNLIDIHRREKSSRDYVSRYLDKLERSIGFDTNCAICMELLDKKIRTLTCNHSFHKDCIHVWLTDGISTTCPVCRKDCQLPPPEAVESHII